MFFCNKCGYSYSTTHDIKSVQHGGKDAEKINAIFNKFAKNEILTSSDIAKIKRNDIIESYQYENMKKKDREKICRYIKNIDKNFFIGGNTEDDVKMESAIAYFICNNCKNFKPIKSGTLLYSKNYSKTDAVDDNIDYSNMIYDNTLARTKNYICYGEKCETHKNIELREAVMCKNKNHQLIYVCVHCQTHWIEGV